MSADVLPRVARTVILASGFLVLFRVPPFCGTQHLDWIERREPVVKAWAFLDPEYALAQARRLDREWDEGRRLGPLHGVPVGVKDIFDTADMPTELERIFARLFRTARWLAGLVPPDEE
jgi:hypothetical protein